MAADQAAVLISCLSYVCGADLKTLLHLAKFQASSFGITISIKILANIVRMEKDLLH